MGKKEKSKGSVESSSKFKPIVRFSSLSNQKPTAKGPKQQSVQVIDLDESDQLIESSSRAKEKLKKSENHPSNIIQEDICKSEIVVSVENDSPVQFRPIYLHRNYTTHIRPVLAKLSADDQATSKQIGRAIMYFREEFQIHRQNRVNAPSKNSKQVSFGVIHNFHHDLGVRVFRKAMQFILDNQNNPEMLKIPIFEAGESGEYSLTKWQVLFVICSMSLCLIIQQYHDVTERKYRFTYLVDFSFYFSVNQWKTKCILEYMRHELENYHHPEKDTMPNRIVTIKRCPIETEISCAIHEHENKKLPSIRVLNDDSVLDDKYGELKIFHTNSFIGGGECLDGLSQEDVFIAGHPQMHCLLVLSEQMNDNECVCLLGFRKFSRIEMTKYEVVYDGEDKDYPLDMDSQNRLKDYVLVLNSPKFHRECFRDQFQKKKVDQELAKVYYALNVFKQIANVKFEQVVSGHWGTVLCWGDARKRLTCFWIASAMVGFECCFCPYGDFRHIYDKDFMYQMKGKSVKEAYERLEYGSKKIIECKDSIYVFMLMK